MYENVLSLISPAHIGLRIAGALVGITAFGTGLSLVIPSLVDKLMPPPTQDDLWMYLPFESLHEDRKTIICENNRYIRIVELKGADITLASESAAERLYEARKHFIDELERNGVEQAKIIQVKERVGLKRTLHPREPLIRTVTDLWEKTFPAPYMLRHYVILTVKAKNYRDAAAILDSAETFTVSALADYRPHIMQEPSQDELKSLNEIDNTIDRPSGPLRALAHLVSPVSRPDPYGAGYKGPLSALITADDVDFSKLGKRTIVFEHGSQKRYAAIITFRDCGEKTTESIMRDVMAIDSEMLIYHAIEPIPTAAALIDLNRGRAASVGEHLSLNARESYDEVLRKVEGQVSDERAGLCYYALHIMPIAKTEKELAAIQSRLTAIMTRAAGTIVRLGPSAQPTFMSTVSFDQIWPRRFRFLSTNIATQIYPQKSETGMMRSDWCDEPIAWFKTVGGDPYPFHFHAHSGRNAPAHCCLIGPTGAGKTSLLTFLAGSAMRVPNLRVYLLDRLNGMYIYNQCANGRLVSFDGEAKNASLNPFHLPDRPENRKFLQRWLRLLAETNDPASDDEIARAVSLIYSQPLANRSLRALSRAAFRPDGDVRKNLEPWLSDAAYGGYFSAPEDSLDLEGNRLITFNMTDILLDERLAPAIMHYLMHRIKNLSMTTTDPSLIIIDETRPMLRSAVFAQEFLETGLMEGRKLGQAYVLCFQTPQALRDTGREQIILDQCQVLIFFRNPRDSENAAKEYEMFGLNEAEINFVVGRTFKDRRYAVLIKRQNSNDSAIVDVDLSRLGKYLGVFESDARQVAVLQQLLENHHHDKAVEMYLETRK